MAVEKKPGNIIKDILHFKFKLIKSNAFSIVKIVLVIVAFVAFSQYKSNEYEDLNRRTYADAYSDGYKKGASEGDAITKKFMGVYKDSIQASYPNDNSPSHLTKYNSLYSNVGLMADFMIKVNPNLSKDNAISFAESIIRTSSRSDVHPILLLALASVESTYKPHSRSKNGAVGPVQILPKVWTDPKNKDNLINAGIIRSASELSNPARNFQAGLYILSKYYNYAFENRKDRNVSSNTLLINYALSRYKGGSELQSGYVEDIKSQIGAYVLFMIDSYMLDRRTNFDKSTLKVAMSGGAKIE